MDNSVQLDDAARVTVLLQCVSEGFSPSDAAKVLRKTAADIRTFTNEAVKQHRGIKTASNPLGWITETLAAYPALWVGTAALPAVGGAAVGHVVGGQLGEAAAENPEFNLSELRKIRRVQEYRKRTREILQRVQEAQERAKQKPDTSVRRLF